MTMPTAKQKYQTFAPGELALHPRNPRLGDVPKIKASLRAHGQYKPVVVNRGTHTGRPNEVLAGNQTLRAFRELQDEEPDVATWRSVDARMIDVDDEEATRILLKDNKIGQFGGFDDELLAGLLSDYGLEGTEYTEDEYSDLLAGLEEIMPTSTDLGDDNVLPKPPRTGEDGLISSTDIETQANSYVDAATRLVVLTLPINQFIWSQSVFTRIREDKGLESNTAVVLELLAMYSGEDVPMAPVDAQPTEEVL